jgi:hypothetical protein
MSFLIESYSYFVVRTIVLPFAISKYIMRSTDQLPADPDLPSRLMGFHQHTMLVAVITLGMRSTLPLTIHP